MGRIRRKLADLILRDCGVSIDPSDIHANNYPAARIVGACRWTARGTEFVTGHAVNVCSWDTMTELAAAKKLEIASRHGSSLEITSG